MTLKGKAAEALRQRKLHGCWKEAGDGDWIESGSMEIAELVEGAFG